MQIRTIIVLLFTLSLSVLPVKAGVEVQPRIVTLKDKVESLESEYGVRFVYSWKKHRRYIMLGLEPPVEVRDSIRTMAARERTTCFFWTESLCIR